ncbi:YIP1 family protein [Shouchella shacheensis]|uniref:YIP1 family protein n=1 Tax=Shouchella shacheensis TaxID=1649580 RepID=UPI00073FFFF8|nr:YIP1 family protein [Shouchella shacheensis]
MNKSKTSVNPWLHVWIKPRRVVADATAHELNQRSVLILSLIFGCLMTLTNSDLQALLLLGDLSLPLFLGISLIGSLLGPSFLYIMSLLIGTVGKWYSGTGNRRDVKVALLFTHFMPAILVSLLALIHFFTIAMELRGQRTGFLSFLQDQLELLISIGNGWVVILTVFGIAQAHRVSAWKGILIGLVFLAAVLVLIIGISMIVHALIA